jgi:hypothetical protein
MPPLVERLRRPDIHRQPRNRQQQVETLPVRQNEIGNRFDDLPPLPIGSQWPR